MKRENGDMENGEDDEPVHVEEVRLPENYMAQNNELCWIIYL